MSTESKDKPIFLTIDMSMMRANCLQPEVHALFVTSFVLRWEVGVVEFGEGGGIISDRIRATSKD
jgi:hypothetical protein